jgi:putative protease
MRRLELLAPAKNLESGIAAIDHGADAVYIGASRFGARVAASNSVDDIRQLCAYAHLFGAKVYVTVNTIVYDQELAETYQLLDSLEEAGADAVLVQDMAVADYLLNKQGRMDIHASTQTDNRTTEKVRWLAHQGFSRVVLARELSVEEISQIHKNVPDVELEVFVHGALCVSYSGLCYASQYCFGRSANRGECAQFCRMKFDLLDAAGNSVAPQRYYLSLKDMNQSDELQSLIEAGATSFKIEGRLKDITYVKNVTAAYSELLNAFIARNPGQYERASRGHCTYTFKPDLRKSFNRGYTHYFLKGRQPDIASFDTPKAIGEYVGKVKEIRGNTLSVAGLASFANGDGLCFLNDKRELEGFRVNKVEGNKLSLLKMPSSLRTGAALYRNNDQEFERLLSRPSAKRKIPVKMSFTETPIGYRFSMDGVSLDVEAEHVMAKSPQRDNVIRQLTKLGDTPYECVDFTIDNDFSFFIPSSQLTIIRREMVEKYQLESNLMDSKTTLPATSSSLPEPYSPTYLYNISNGKARVFYERQGLVSPATAFEIEQPKGEKLLMQCRHCIRYSLGYCVKRGGKQPIWHEPLYLRLSDGRRFRLAFDCHHCQMNVYAENH